MKRLRVWTVITVIEGDPMVSLYDGTKTWAQIRESIHEDLAGPMLDDDTTLKALKIRTIAEFKSHWAVALDHVSVELREVWG